MLYLKKIDPISFNFDISKSNQLQITRPIRTNYRDFNFCRISERFYALF